MKNLRKWARRRLFSLRNPFKRVYKETVKKGKFINSNLKNGIFNWEAYSKWDNGSEVIICSKISHPHSIWMKRYFIIDEFPAPMGVWELKEGEAIEYEYVD